jgi:4-coumarate--CoA ligase (photoactive yellow protein activation family)
MSGDLGALRIVRDLLAHALAAARRVPVSSLRHWEWPADAMPDCSPEESRAAAAELADWCGRSVGGRRLADWAAIVAGVLDDPAGVIHPRTSGSTGVPKPCAHALRDLQAECAAWASLLAPVRRVVCCVPVHHIYGAIWGVLLPRALGVPVVTAGYRGPGLSLPAPRPGDLILSVPAQWPHLLRAVPAWPGAVQGVTSTAPMPADLAATIAAAGIVLWQIYGSSETAAVGWRRELADPYTLLPVWRRHGNELVRATDGTPAALQDELDWTAPDRFHVLGRRDGAVQVGGINVHPARVAAALRAAPGVAECAVRLGADGRLKAFVVATDGQDLREALRAHARATLTEAERPRHYAFGAALPRDAMGKLKDWD